MWTSSPWIRSFPRIQPTQPRLDRVRIPVALAYAPTDTLHSSANIRLMADRLPRATVVTCPSNLYMHSAEVMRDIEAFLRAQAPSLT